MLRGRVRDGYSACTFPEPDASCPEACSVVTRYEMPQFRITPGRQTYVRRNSRVYVHRTGPYCSYTLGALSLDFSRTVGFSYVGMRLVEGY